MNAAARNRGWIFTTGVALVAALTVPGGAERVSAQESSAKDNYVGNCRVCHGTDGAGKTATGKRLNVRDVRGTVKELTADQMIAVVTDGKAPDMGGYGKEFSADQIRQIVEYFRSLANPNP